MEKLSSNGIACYTTRDLILYAIGIGCGNNNSPKSATTIDDDDLLHVYEHHVNFAPFPTFPLVLPFRAIRRWNEDNEDSINDNKDTGCHYFGMPLFPTPLMKQMNVIQFIQDHITMMLMSNNKEKYGKGNNHNSNNDNIIYKNNKPFQIEIEAVIHLSEKLRLHEDIPNHYKNNIDDQNRTDATFVKIKNKVCSIVPKSIGIIVITETEYYIQRKENHNKNKVDQFCTLLATSQSTTLYIIKQQHQLQSLFQPLYNLTYQSSLNSPRISSIGDYIQQYKPDSIICEKIPINQALIYRLSGDTNSIHVHPSNSFPFSSDRAILHGLCTLGYSVRIVLNNYYCCQIGLKGSNDHDIKFHYVSCQFVKPVFVGDELEFAIWEYHGGDDQNQVIDCCDYEIGHKVLLFQVRNKSNDAVVVKNGLVEVESKRHLKSLSKL